MSKPTAEQTVAYGYPVYAQKPAVAAGAPPPAGYGYSLPEAQPALKPYPPVPPAQHEYQQQQPPEQYYDDGRRSITDLPRRITPFTLLNPFRLVHLIVATAALPFKSTSGPGGSAGYGTAPPMMMMGYPGRRHCCGRRGRKARRAWGWCASAAWQPKGLPPLQQQQQQQQQAWQPAAPSKGDLPVA